MADGYTIYSLINDPTSGNKNRRKFLSRRMLLDYPWRKRPDSPPMLGSPSRMVNVGGSYPEVLLGSLMWEIFSYICRQEQIKIKLMIEMCLSSGQEHGITTSIHKFCLEYLFRINPTISKQYLDLLLSPWPLGPHDDKHVEPFGSPDEDVDLLAEPNTSAPILNADAARVGTWRSQRRSAALALWLPVRSAEK